MDHIQTVPETVSQALSSHFGDTLRGKTVIAAISGGVDSVVLVQVLWKLQPVFGYRLTAVTVDHNIRTDGTSSRDADFAVAFCNSLDLSCIRHELPPGKVSEEAGRRGGGLEEAARFLRYAVFDRLSTELSAAAVFLAHNRNDQLETILERFLQGGDSTALRGIPESRPPYFRPMLHVSRKDIESYAREQQLNWYTDPTNADVRYFRNRIRHQLMPLLDEAFDGWDTGITKAAEKASLEAAVLESLTDACPWCQDTEGAISSNAASFLSQPLAVRIRILYNGLRLLSGSRRIPYDVLRTFSETLVPVTVQGMRLSAGKERISLERISDTRPVPDGFVCFIDRPGTYRIPLGIIVVESSDGRTAVARHTASGLESGAFQLPAVIRSAGSSDTVMTKDNKTKGVLKILAGWKVPASVRNEIPVIEDSLIRCIWGRPAGYQDWSVLQGVDCE